MTLDTTEAAEVLPASRCTGPRSEAGKAIVSQNALRHGFLSRKMFVGDENPDEFQMLVDELTSSLQPVGALEASLIEKIAVIMWRQRRLVRSETAALSLQRQPGQVVRGINGELRRGLGTDIKEGHLQPFDTDREQWCRTAVREFEALETMDLETLKAKAPCLHRQLLDDAEDEEPAQFIAKRKGGLSGYLLELMQWCREQLKEAEARPQIHAIADLVRERSLVLSVETLELFSRYQTTLDNHLYKAMRAFRDTQDARLRILDAREVPDAPDTRDVTDLA